MNVKGVLTGFVMVAPIVLVVSLVVSYLYGLLVHGSGVLDWESSIRLAIIFGIALPLIRQLDGKKGS
jgi:hypothetical protein